MRWRGPCLVTQHLDSQLPGLPGSAGRPPVPCTRDRCRFPGPCHVPGVSPGAVPVSNGESISTCPGGCRARVYGNFAAGFFCPHSVHRKRVVVRSYRRLSTSLCTAFPQITDGNPQNTISGTRFGASGAVRSAARRSPADGGRPPADGRDLPRGHRTWSPVRVVREGAARPTIDESTARPSLARRPDRASSRQMRSSLPAFIEYLQPPRAAGMQAPRLRARVRPPLDKVVSHH